MKIEQSSISMTSQHTYSQQVSRTETLRAWIGEQRPDFEGRGANGSAAAEPSARVAISNAAREAAGEAARKTAAATAAEEAAVIDEPMHDPKLELLIRIIERLTGEKVKIMSASEMERISNADTSAASTGLDPADAQARPQGWGIEYDYHEAIHEREETSFTATGEIHTADGKRIQFSLALEMRREYHHEVSVSLRAGDAVRKDPLVINFDGNAAELSDLKFDFDIDADGQADRISFVGPGSGFLVLDRNGNGRIDDGSELFGARTGDGFAELAAYDTDGNGWIDENDAAFADLRVWTKGGDGADHLSTLAARNIGALYLGKAATPFDLKDGQNRQHGQVLATGLYLFEDGRAGTIQQLDLFV